MNLNNHLRRLAPDVAATVHRFPFPTILAATATLVALALINEWVDSADETWPRLAIGLATAAAFAVGGILFGESRPENRIATAVLAYILPLVMIGLFQVRSEAWSVPYLWPAVAVLWVSISAFTRPERGQAREMAQDRFWWLNHRAIATAAIAVLGFGIIALGLLAIERSLDLLLGVSVNSLFYDYVLPVVGLFFTPLYWLSTIPHLDEFHSRELDEPDFLSTAIGFLGQFVLAPLLFAYAAILLVYAAQIVGLRELPEGVIGWLVLGFTVVGAANWLLLHPRFMRDRALVRVFRRAWFWLTIVPISLYAIAVYIRVDVYGLTPERILLIAGGLWAALLTLAFLSRRLADIRLIPGVAALLLALLAVGPWNLANLPKQDQASRLDAALAEAATGEGSFTWTARTARHAYGAAAYLNMVDATDLLRSVLASHGVTDLENYGAIDVAKALALPLAEAYSIAKHTVLHRRADVPVDLGEARVLLGNVDIWSHDWQLMGPLEFRLGEGTAIVAREPEGEPVAVDLSGWLSRQPTGEIEDPRVRFTVGGRTYLLVVSFVGTEAGAAPDKAPSLVNLSALLFGGT